MLGGSGVAFEKCLFEVVERCDWRLFAYVLMNNHYHLATGNNGVGSVDCSMAEDGPFKSGEQINQ